MRSVQETKKAFPTWDGQCEKCGSPCDFRGVYVEGDEPRLNRLICYECALGMGIPCQEYTSGNNAQPCPYCDKETVWDGERGAYVCPSA